MSAAVVKRKSRQRRLLPPGATSTTTPAGIARFDPHARAAAYGPLRLADFPLLPKRADGWWYGTPFDDWPEAGPYNSRPLADEGRQSFVRNWIGNFKPHQVSRDRPRKPERRPPKPKVSKTKRAKS